MPIARKLRLQTKILILVSVVTVFFMSVIVWFDSYSLEKSVAETYVSQLDGMTTAINGRYEESHSYKDVQQIFDYIQYKNANVIELTLFGKREVLASTNRARIGERSPPDLVDRLAKHPTIVDHPSAASGGVPTVRLTAPLKEDGVTIGAIQLLLNTSDNHAMIRNRIVFIVAVWLSITLLLLLTLSIIIRKLLLRPLLKIRESALSVREGSAYKEIPLQFSQEINEVADAFNGMVDKLERRYDELRQTQHKLVESEKMVALGNLVAGVSHEINTPVGIGVTAASFLDEKSLELLRLYEQNQMKRSDLEQYLHTIRETSGMIQSNLLRASELIRSFKQIAVDTSSQAKRSFRLKEYIEELLISLQPRLKRTQQRVEVSGPAELEMVGDPGAVSQIVTNLIMNSLIHAYDADRPGVIRIALASTPKRDLITIRYADDGKGMAPEIAEQIFLPFFTTNRAGGGTGLGMYIVYNLVTQSLGGSIQCESAVGIGTVFTIQLPRNEGTQ